MILARLVALCARHRWPMLMLAIALAVASAWTVRSRLGVETDTGTLFSDRLKWKQRGAELQRAFPQNEDIFVAVVDAALPEEAELTARDLAAALAEDHTHFSAVSRPD